MSKAQGEGENFLLRRGRFTLHMKRNGYVEFMPARAKAPTEYDILTENFRKAPVLNELIEELQYLIQKGSGRILNRATWKSFCEGKPSRKMKEEFEKLPEKVQKKIIDLSMQISAIYRGMYD